MAAYINPQFNSSGQLERYPTEAEWNAVWTSPAWQSLEWESVQLQFFDSSTISLRLDTLAVHVATKLRIRHLDTLAHLTEQVVPLVTAEPSLLLSHARELTLNEICMLSEFALWRTRGMYYADEFKAGRVRLFMTKKLSNSH